MFIGLKKKFDIMEHGVQAGYWDNNKKKAIQVVRVFPGKPEEVSDKEGVLVIEGSECFEEAPGPLGKELKSIDESKAEVEVDEELKERHQPKKKGAKK